MTPAKIWDTLKKAYDAIANGTYGLSALKTVIDSNSVRTPMKGNELATTVTAPDVVGTTRDLFDGGSTTDAKVPADWNADWITDAQARIHIRVDANAMQANDVTIITFYGTADGANYRTLATYTYNDAQTIKMKEYEIITLTAYPIKGELSMSAGTARAYPVASWADLGKRKRA